MADAECQLSLVQANEEWEARRRVAEDGRGEVERRETQSTTAEGERSTMKEAGGAEHAAVGEDGGNGGGGGQTKRTTKRSGHDGVEACEGALQRRQRVAEDGSDGHGHGVCVCVCVC